MLQLTFDINGIRPLPVIPAIRHRGPIQHVTMLALKLHRVPRFIRRVTLNVTIFGRDGWFAFHLFKQQTNIDFYRLDMLIDIQSPSNIFVPMQVGGVDDHCPLC